MSGSNKKKNGRGKQLALRIAAILMAALLILGIVVSAVRAIFNTGW